MEIWEAIKLISGVIAIMALIITSQLMKYEDRKDGRRWWER